MIEAKCVQACFWQGRYWNEGERYRGTETPPHHFVDVNEMIKPLQEPKKTKGKDKEETA